MSKAKYRAAAFSLDGEEIDDGETKAGGIGRERGEWEILYYGITVPIRFAEPFTPPPPPPPEP